MSCVSPLFDLQLQQPPVEAPIFPPGGKRDHLPAIIQNQMRHLDLRYTYAIAIAMSFVQPRIAGGIYVLVALLWLIPDRRIERLIKK